MKKSSNGIMILSALAIVLLIMIAALSNLLLDRANNSIEDSSSTILTTDTSLVVSYPPVSYTNLLNDPIFASLISLYDWRAAPVPSTFELYDCSLDGATFTSPKLKLDGYQITSQDVPQSKYDGVTLRNLFISQGWEYNSCNIGDGPGNLFAMTKDDKKLLVTEDFDYQKETWTINVFYQL